MNRLDEIRKRLEETTPGPWTYDGYNTTEDANGRTMFTIPDHPFDEMFTHGQIAERSAWYAESGRNADMLTHAPADIRFLLAELEATQAKLDVLTKHITTPQTVEWMTSSERDEMIKDPVVYEQRLKKSN
jgi:hypothetical protein